ncbi:MAG: hypothetical protein AAFV33_25420 [Chloroflexota bacterium]
MIQPIAEFEEMCLHDGILFKVLQNIELKTLTMQIHLPEDCGQQMEYGELIFYGVENVKSEPHWEVIDDPDIVAETYHHSVDQATLSGVHFVILYQKWVDGELTPSVPILLDFHATEFEWKRQPDQTGYNK